MEVTLNNAANYIGETVKVNDNRYGKIVNVFENGILTTAGFVPGPVELSDCVSITYTSKMALELPVNWHDILFLDDKNKYQHISQIDFEYLEECVGELQYPVYMMEDGTVSWEVTVG